MATRSDTLFPYTTLFRSLSAGREAFRWAPQRKGLIPPPPVGPSAEREAAPVFGPAPFLFSGERLLDLRGAVALQVQQPGQVSVVDPERGGVAYGRLGAECHTDAEIGRAHV